MKLVAAVKMRRGYIQAALERVRYELMHGAEPYYGEVPELPGVWSKCKAFEDCRRNLADVLDGWIC